MNNPQDDMQCTPLCDSTMHTAQHTTEYEHEHDDEHDEGAHIDNDDDDADEGTSTVELEMQSLLSFRSSSDNQMISEHHTGATTTTNRNHQTTTTTQFCPLNIHIPPSPSTISTPNNDPRRQQIKGHHHHPPDPEVFITRTLSQIDVLEDDFDEFTHKKLLPVPIQIALEENIFGWSHLLSDVLGHILYPLISAVLTYQAISLCYYAFDVYDGRYQRHTGDDNTVDIDSSNVNANLDTKQGDQLSPFLIGVRNLLTVASLIASYRTVRRRRKVWLTHYDPKVISSVDRDTEMGRKWLAVQHSNSNSSSKHHNPKLQKKVERASKKYDAKLRQVHVLQNNKLTKSVSVENLLACSTCSLEDSSVVSLSSPSSSHEHRQHSVITKISRIHNIPYTHGGYFASAPYMLHDPQWIYILRQLMPDVYVEVARRVHLGDAKLIHWAENNPVVAAYGTIMSCSSNTNNNVNTNTKTMDVSGAVALEWDVFLDPILASRLTTALDVQSTMISKRHETTQLRHVNNLIQTRALHLVANMLIAHGNATQLILEQIPYPHIVKSMNFTRVKHARKTLGGGIEVSRWLAIYAAALKMGWKCSSSKSNVKHNSAASTPLQSPDNSSSSDDDDEDDDCSGADEDSPEHLISKLNQAEHIPLRTSIAAVKKLMNKELTVLLDIKSRHVDKRVWALVISTLQKLGISIEGIGSFFASDIRGISDMIASQGHRPCREVIFFHSIGDLQFACHMRQVCDGDTVFFNSGSLFQCDFPTDRLYEYKERYNLRIGLYTQEFAVDPVSIQHIIEHVNAHADLYDLGLSWGGVNGITVRSIQPGRFTSTDGYWNQRYLGKYWRADIEVGDEWQSSTCDVVYGTFQ